jgi:hypothetical protein
MGFLVQNSLRFRGWILSALFALVSFVAPVGVSNASSAKRLPSVGIRAAAPLRMQDSSSGALTPAPDLLQDESDSGAASSNRPGRRQTGPRPPEGGESHGILPRKLREGLLKSDFEKMKQDAAELAKLTKSFQEDLENSNEHILSLKIVEKAQKIEGLAKKIAKTAKNY